MGKVKKLTTGKERMGQSRTFKIVSRTLDERLEMFQSVRKITFFQVNKTTGRIHQQTAIGFSHLLPVDTDNVSLAEEDAFRNAIPQIDFSFDSFTIVDEAFIQYEKIPVDETIERQEFIEEFR